MNPLKTRSFRLDCESLESRDTPSGTPAIATGAAVGSAPYVTVYDNNGTQLAHFLAYDAGYTGGVNVAVGNVKGDGSTNIITAPKTGVANIRVFDGISFQLVNSFNAFDPGFTGGASIAMATLYSDGIPDIIVGAGAGGGPNVRVFNGMEDTLVLSFYALDSSFLGGVNVAATSYQLYIPPLIAPNYRGMPIPVITQGRIYAAAGPGGGPHVVRYSMGSPQNDSVSLYPDESFYAYDPTFRGGVTIAATIDSDIITGAGVGGSSNLHLYTPISSIGLSVYSLTGSISVGTPNDTGGVFVGTDGHNIFAIADPLSAQSTVQVYDITLNPIIYGQYTGPTYGPGITNWGHIGSFPT